MRSSIILYSLKHLDQQNKVLVKRALFGFVDNSNKGSYKYKRKGLLEAVSHIKPINSVIILKQKDKQKVLSALRKLKAKCWCYTVHLGKDSNKLK